MLSTFADTAFDTPDFIFTPKPLFQKGQIVTHAHLGASGVVLFVTYREFLGEYVYTVRVPGLLLNDVWTEHDVVASTSISAVVVGDMVIADSDYGERHMGPCVGFHEGMLAVRFGDIVYAVNMARVWRVVPMSLVRSSASFAA